MWRLCEKSDQLSFVQSLGKHYSSDQTTLFKSLIRPLTACKMLFFFVRVYEKIMEKMNEQARQMSGLGRMIGKWAKGVALQGNMNKENG